MTRGHNSAVNSLGCCRNINNIDYFATLVNQTTSQEMLSTNHSLNCASKGHMGTSVVFQWYAPHQIKLIIGGNTNLSLYYKHQLFPPDL
jgi:hypothetical protein